MTRTTRTPLLLAIGAAAALLAGCAGDTADATTDPGQAAPGLGMCAPGVTDCEDVVMDDTRPSDDTLREQAQLLLGTAEVDVPADVRIGRRGDEHMMLTEDYVIGRMTVGLDDDGTGTFVVTEVILEMEEGPETFAG